MEFLHTNITKNIDGFAAVLYNIFVFKYSKGYDKDSSRQDTVKRVRDSASRNKFERR